MEDEHLRQMRITGQRNLRDAWQEQIAYSKAQRATDRLFYWVGQGVTGGGKHFKYKLATTTIDSGWALSGSVASKWPMPLYKCCV